MEFFILTVILMQSSYCVTRLKAIKVETTKSHPASFHLFPLLTTELTLTAI